MNTSIEITEEKKGARPSFVALCGRVFRADPEFFPQVEYRGETIYLCTDACLGAFLSDPDRFYAVHQKTYQPKNHA